MKLNLPNSYAWAANCTDQDTLFYFSVNPAFSISNMDASKDNKGITELRKYFDELQTIKISSDSSVNRFDIQRASSLIAKNSRRGMANVLLKPNTLCKVFPSENMNVYTVNDLLEDNELILMYSGNHSSDRSVFITELGNGLEIKRFDMHPQYKERCIKLIVG